MPKTPGAGDRGLRRRQFICGALALALLPAVVRAAPARAVEVWKDPDCGCCNDWIRHVEASGLRTRVHDTGNLQARDRLGMPDDAWLSS